MKIKGKSAYYSHSKRIYDTKEEKEFLEAINKKFKGTVICPNNHIGELTNKDDYLSIVRKMDCIFVSKFEGYIGVGSYKECDAAIDFFTPVYLVERNGKGFSFRYVICVQIECENNPVKYASIDATFLQ